MRVRARALAPLTQALGPTRWLAYGADSDADAGLHRQRGSLRAALMLAQLTKRTLVLPPFWRRAAHDASSRPCHACVDMHMHMHMHACTCTCSYAFACTQRSGRAVLRGAGTNLPGNSSLP